MDIIQGLIDTGNAGRSGWRIVNNGGAIGVLNNRTSNVLFSIINEGIGTSSNVPSSFINSYSGINVSNYTGTGSVSSGSGSSGGSTGSLWSSNVSGSKIYYNSGNIGIGATDPIAPLHIYNTSNTRLLLDATTTGTASVEFRRGTGADALNDYRFINDTSNSLKLQVENTTQSFGNTIADLAWFSSNDTIIHKNTSMSGRVGIGTVYHATRSLDVLGDTNVSGTVSVGGLSSTSNATLTNSITSNTSFTIHNGFTGSGITTSPSATTTAINGLYTIMVFTYTSGTTDTTYTITAPAGGVVCDILVVGGGGGGGKTDAGGGGAGGLLYIQNTTLTGNYTIKVGKGGLGGTGSGQIGVVGNKGTNSSFIGTNANHIAYGGGGGGYGHPSDVEPSNLGPYGSSGGLGTGDQIRETYNVPTAGQGNLGGLGTASVGAGGGGGSGGAGVNSGNGGIGTQINITGTNLYYAGGGGGGHVLNGTSGGLGGGGSATYYIGNNATYYGGGGGGGGANFGDGGNGFEGIVIIRYLTPPSSSSSINLIRGTTADTNNDYKVGNFNGEFKVISSVSSVDTDYIRITTAGAITNPSGTANWNTGSDRRIKENIKRASYDKCLENINRLELNCFNYVSGFNTVNRDKTQLGFIAQEVSAIFPKSISTQGYYSDTLSIPDLLSIDISQINYALYGAVKKLIEINDEKDSCFKAMDEELKELELTLNITPEAVASSNLVLEDTVATTSNVLVEPLVLEETVATTSNLLLEPLVLEETVATTSNLLLEPLVLEEATSNLLIEPLVLEETVATTSNLLVEPLVSQDTTSNLLLDTF
jgi:hypothetical protein